MIRFRQRGAVITCFDVPGAVWRLRCVEVFFVGRFVYDSQ